MFASVASHEAEGVLRPAHCAVLCPGARHQSRTLATSPHPRSLRRLMHPTAGARTAASTPLRSRSFTWLP